MPCVLHLCENPFRDLLLFILYYKEDIPFCTSCITGCSSSGSPCSCFRTLQIRYNSTHSQKISVLWNLSLFLIPTIRSKPTSTNTLYRTNGWGSPRISDLTLLSQFNWSQLPCCRRKRLLTLLWDRHLSIKEVNFSACFHNFRAFP